MFAFEFFSLPWTLFRNLIKLWVFIKFQNDFSLFLVLFLLLCSSLMVFPMQGWGWFWLNWSVIEMDGDFFSSIGSTAQVDGKVLQTFQKSFGQVQHILDQNRLLINEINQNHESKIPDNLSRNVGLIRELNNNIRRVVDLYADLSSSVSKSVDVSSEADSGGSFKSNGKASQKRIRSG